MTRLIRADPRAKLRSALRRPSVFVRLYLRRDRQQAAGAGTPGADHIARFHVARNGSHAFCAEWGTDLYGTRISLLLGVPGSFETLASHFQLLAGAGCEQIDERVLPILIAGAQLAVRKHSRRVESN